MIRPLLAAGLCAALSCPAHSGDADAKMQVRTRSSPFGIGSSAANDGRSAVWLPLMAEIGLCELRSVGGCWGVRPTADSWSWSWYDRRLDIAARHGFATGALLDGLASWNTVDRKHGLPLKSLPQWRDLVSGMVPHLKGRVRRFEVWNEPPNGTNDAPATDYAQVVIATHEAAHVADPDAQVGIAAKSAHISYIDQALRAGARGHFDFITLHPYEILGNVISQPGSEAIFMGIVPTVRRMLRAQDPDRYGCDVIFSEIGYDTRHGKAGRSGTELQWHAVIKAYTMGIAQGATTINWYEAMDGDAGPLGLVTTSGEKRPAYHALGQLTHHLGRHPGYLGWIQLNGLHYGFIFSGPAGPVLVTWASRWEPDEIDFADEVQVIDPPSGQAVRTSRHTLTVAPVIIPDPPAGLVAEAGRNLTRPFPWGGDYSQAKSVSVGFGTTNRESGLHTMSAQNIAKDVLAYGGNARAGTVPGGNVFMVDPNFLSYDTVPIEITAVVRRNEADQGDRLVLEYESTTGNGYKKTKPFLIPDNKQWHVASWRIDDSQFVGTWAFNFRLNAGPYAIQSVTVTRLDR